MAETFAIIGALASVASAGVQVLRAQQEASAARAQAALMQVQARQGEVQAQAEELRGQQAALDTRERLLRVLAAQNARYLAAGLAIGEGTPEAVAEDSAAAAERELDIIRTDTVLRAETARIGAATAREMSRVQASAGRVSLLAGAGGALATLGEGAARAYDRWPGRAQAPAPAPVMR